MGTELVLGDLYTMYYSIIHTHISWMTVDSPGQHLRWLQTKLVFPFT